MFRIHATATPGDPTIPATAVATNAGDYFEANQTGSTGTVHGASVEVDGGPEFAAAEMATAAGSPTLADTGDISGAIVWIERARRSLVVTPSATKLRSTQRSPMVTR